MTGLDTNVLVRYLVKDDTRQGAAAATVIKRAANKSEKLVVQPVVLCELVWVLTISYGLRRPLVAATLDEILRTAQFEIPDLESVSGALADYQSGKGDFADYYIGRANERSGVESTLTFDKALKTAPRFALLP